MLPIIIPDKCKRSKLTNLLSVNFDSKRYCLIIFCYDVTLRNINWMFLLVELLFSLDTLEVGLGR